MRTSFIGLALALALAVGTPISTAQAARAVELSEDQTAAMKQIAGFLRGFKELQGEFTQISPKGNVSKGVFFIKKPGKMRFEYAAPNPFLIVSDGTWVTIQNRAKDRADQYPLSQTPLRLVLDDDVDLLKETKVLDFQESEGIYTVTLEDKGGAMPGNLVLVYDGNSKKLQQWIVVDGQGRRTTVSLDNIVAGIDADPKLFKIKVNQPNKKKQGDR